MNIFLALIPFTLSLKAMILSTAPVVQTPETEHVRPITVPAEFVGSDISEAEPTQIKFEQAVELAPEVTSPSSAASESSIDLTEEDILSHVNARMNETTSAKGGFVQRDALGNVATGDFFLRRPGKIRFEYADPTPYLIVSDGVTVAIEDRQLDTIDRTPLSTTPLKHFLKKDLDLAKDANVVDVKTVGDQYLVAVVDKPSEDEEAIEGQLILQFDTDTYDLMGWISVDGLGDETRVSLLDIETNVKIPAKKFFLEDDDDRRN